MPDNSPRLSVGALHLSAFRSSPPMSMIAKIPDPSLQGAPTTGMQTKSILSVAWLFLCLCVMCSVVAEAQESKDEVSYPNVWFRSFDRGQLQVVDAFFSDQSIWGNEPVVILSKPNASAGIAVGFFSGKRRAISSIAKGAACTPRLLSHYFYLRTKREMERRYMASQEPCTVHRVDLPGGGALINVRDATLSAGWIDPPLDSLLPKDLNQIGEAETQCEPISSHWARVNGSGNVVWADSFVRLYPDHGVAPEQKNDRCLSRRIRVESAVENVLLLPDGTALFLTPESVIRVRNTDGTTPFSSPVLRVFPTSKVIDAKLDLIRSQVASSQTCSYSGSVAKAVRMKCAVYPANGHGMERLQVDLATKLFPN